MNLEKKTLNQFLKSAKALAGRNALSVLNNVAIRIDPDKIHLRVTNLETWLTASIPFERGEAFPIENALKLNERLYPIAAITAVASVKRGKLCEIDVIDDFLYIDGTKVPSGGFSIDKFPIIPFEIDNVRYMGRINKFDNLIEAFRYVSEDETRYFMNGVYFEIRNDKVTAVATDGRVLYRSDPSFGVADYISGENPGEAGYIIRPFPKHHHLRLERFQCGDKGIMFYDDVFHLYVTNIDGRFPNYQRVIPDVTDYNKWEFDLDDFKETARQLVIQAKIHGIKKLDKIRIVMTKDASHVALAEKTEVMKPIGENVFFENSLPSGEYISFNMKYLMMMLDTDNNSEFFIHAELPEIKACLLVDNTKEALKIYMPMMVRD